MPSCSFCKKRFESGTGNLFHMPKDPIKRAKWSQICGKNFAATSLICVDHFSPASIIRTGNKVLLLSNAEPLVNQLKGVKYQSQDLNTFSTSYDATPTPTKLFTNPLNRTSSASFSTYTQFATSQHTNEQETQTVTELNKLQYIEKVRALESERKDLQLKLSQAQMAVHAMRQIFTEGQIRKLMSPAAILWRKEDIESAVSWHAAGPRAYDYLYKRGFPLPHVSTLRRWGPKTYTKEETVNIKSSHETNYSLLEAKSCESASEVQKMKSNERDHLEDRQNVENNTRCSYATEPFPATVKQELLDIDDVSANINYSEPTVVKNELSPYIKDEVDFDEPIDTNVGDVGINKDNELENISDYVVEKMEFEEFECHANSDSWIAELSKRPLETSSDNFVEANNAEESKLPKSNKHLKQTSNNFAEELEET